ncbi:GTP-binding protein SAR1-like [Ylistrum balloti]|uniref:GTP-binding protein SAR1-like n=1 Tax=Ylistrum balloti TaxID=509963 RepID=UPI002905C93B|nr:GTP-binding protein SAR1-like [Ylistrum balloti]
MFLWDWLHSLLYYFGFNRNAKIVIVGLDNAGKSTLLNMLKTGRAAQFPPTGQARSEEMTIGGLTIQAYDLGGHAIMRRVWLDYFPAVDGIVYMVDAADRERLQESKTELTRILDDPEIPPIPILILGNKTDKGTAIGKEELIMSFDLQRRLYKETGYNETENGRPPLRECQLFMCSLLKKQGYGDAFRWLAKATKK